MADKLTSTHGLSARVTFELTDENGKPVAAVHVTRPVGAGDDADVVDNCRRVADHLVLRLYEQLRAARSGSLIVLDIRAAECRLALASWLRAKADELKGKTLYHPDHYLVGCAERVCETKDYYTQCKDAAEQLRQLRDMHGSMTSEEVVNALSNIADQLFLSTPVTTPKE